ncbi:MAG: hypothetical protein HXX08_14190 [Chloroflexi bacterium]|uniref:Uncharacterized protein n=1 Tax=Candidatus Chlorohelix allophototropha TaxID=3003348 RepID=A0A8T7M4K3_9CHLR|nr:hypothetical protein [Chloroflexota bacterium]WJW69998.1 hypothetical protein OZ401_004799 [Chloroflexota bacterium L227-S17]
MYKTGIKLVLLALLLSTMALSACGDNTATTAAVATTLATTTTSPATTVASTTTMATTAASSKPLRNSRYCEVIPVFQESGKLVQYVYNTQGLSDCPQDAWKALNATDLAKNLGSLQVTLNGPRYWMMDQVIASGDSAAGEVKTFGDLKMQLRAKIEIPAGTTMAGPYSENIIQRNTEYVFLSGKPTFQLVSPNGDTYVMQTYSQIIDPKLSIDDLANLGTRLKLPTGWQFKVVTPDQDLHLVAKGAAYLIQDDLTNSYQKVTK